VIKTKTFDQSLGMSIRGAKKKPTAVNKKKRLPKIDEGKESTEKSDLSQIKNQVGEGDFKFETINLD
jgi:hypothetical protein